MFNSTVFLSAAGTVLGGVLGPIGILAGMKIAFWLAINLVDRFMEIW